MRPLFFGSPAAFRAWLERHHAKKTEVLVGFWKAATRKPSMTWSQAVDEALCFGWIDGIRRSLGTESYTIRFTPRRADSNWSEINLRKMKQLIRAKKMTPAGLRAFEGRTSRKKARYSYEQRHLARLTRAQRAKLDANAKAKAWFESRPPGYRRNAIYWVASAKREETREARFATLLASSARGTTVRHLTPPARTGKSR